MAPFARIRPGANIEQANKDLADISRQLATEFPQTNEFMSFSVAPFTGIPKRELQRRERKLSLPGRALYTSNVLNFRVSHSFSPDFYLKGFVQYNDDRKTANFNFLWWYHYKPGSDLYVVYNQGWDIDLPLTSAEALANSYRVRSRSLAIKMTYWLAR